MTAFSSRIREEVLASYPEWACYSSEERWKDSDPYFVVQVPAPESAATTLPLRISTWDEEITIDFDYYHTHFERWNPEPGDSRNESASLYMRDLLSEKIAVASWWQEGHCRVCAQHEPGGTLAPPFKVSFTKVRVRSWQGSHNVESDAQPFAAADGFAAR
jgi:hypothetical protein